MFPVVNTLSCLHFEHFVNNLLTEQGAANATPCQLFYGMVASTLQISARVIALLGLSFP